MVDKISGNSSYEYPNPKEGRKSPAVQAYEHPSGKKEAVKQKSGGLRNTAGKSSETAREQKGVILDLSSREKKEPAKGQNRSLLASLRKIVAPVIEWIKNFWESDTEKAPAESISGSAAVEMEEGPAAVPEETEMLPPLDEVSEIPDYESMVEETAKSHDLHKLEQMLTQNGTKRLAHHSDLLTYYDRRGKLVEMDDTAKHRVLFGDKNIFKL